MVKLLYIHEMSDHVAYRREILQELLENDGRFEVENIDRPTSYEDLNTVYDRLETGDYDILLSSDPFWIRETNGRAVAGVASQPQKLVVYDLSDNWVRKDLSLRLMRLSDMVGTSSRYLENLAKENCPTVKLYPNGIRATSIEKDESFTTTARYVYSGQIRKLNLVALDRLLALDPEGEVDIYAIDKERADAVEGYVSPRVHILEPIPYESLMGRLHAYKYGLVLFPVAGATKYGMLPDKYFDYCQAGIPTIYSNCNELAHKDFQKTAFDIYSDNFSLEKINPTQEDFQEVISSYNMRKSLSAFIEDMIALYNNPQRPPALEKTWKPYWE